MHRHHRFDNRPLRGESLQVKVTALGGFGLTVDGMATAARGWSRRSAAALVKVLALAPGHRLHREQVMDLLWPDESPARSAPRLHKAAHFARQAAGRHDAIVLRDDVVWLFPGAEVTVDAIRFEELARVAIGSGDADAASEALTWYRGELLPGDQYEEWVTHRRELLHLRRLDVLRVAGEWRELAELDPADEEAQIALMRRHLDAGDAAAALHQYQHLERVLEREMGVEPGEAARRTGIEARLRARADRSGPQSGTAWCSIGEPAAPDRSEAVAPSSRVSALVAELAELVRRERDLVAELVAVGAASQRVALGAADDAR